MSKISELTALAATGIATDDVLPIVDTSATATKKIAMLGFLQACLIAASNAVNDANGNELLKFSTTGSAVNELTVANAATGNAPVISATGGDTNIGITLTPKGTGIVRISSTTLGFPSAGILADANGNELLKFAATVTSAVNELTLTNSATGNPVLLAATGGDTNVGVSLDGKGSGKIILNGTGTGNVRVGTDLELTSAKSIVDANGNEIIKTAATVASAVNEITVTNAATGGRPTISATGGDTNIDLALSAKGTGVVRADVGIVSADPTDGVGYATGAGGAVTQATSRVTGVTLNKVCGQITLVSAAGSTTPASFTVTNSAVAATDVVVVSVKSGTDKRVALVTAVGAGSFEVTTYTLSGTTTEQPVLSFAVIKGVGA